MSDYARDVAERAVATYLEAFFGLLIASWATELDASVITTAAIAAVPAALAVLKGAAAGFVGDHGTASLAR